jgi:hypothetical protein
MGENGRKCEEKGEKRPNMAEIPANADESDARNGE